MASHNTNYSDPSLHQPNYPAEKKSLEYSKVLQRYLLIVFIFVFNIGVLGYFASPLSKVGTISVKGNEAVYDQQIIDASGIHGGDSMVRTWREKENNAEKIVKELPQVSAATVEMSDFNAVEIDVKEYNTVAYIAQDSSYFRVLENGVVLEDVYSVSIGNQPILTKFEEGEALDLMIEELSKVDSPILNLISEIELVKERANPLFIRVYMNNGNRVLSSIPTFSEKIPYYPQMVQAVEGKKGVFDMEVGVYFTPFSDGETEESGLDAAGREELEEFHE